MKKFIEAFTYAFLTTALVAVSFTKAQNLFDTKDIGFLGSVSVRVYCTFSPILGGDNSACDSSIEVKDEGKKKEGDVVPAVNTSNNPNATSTLSPSKLEEVNRAINRTLSNNNTRVVYIAGPQGPAGRDGTTTVVYETRIAGQVVSPTAYINPGSANRPVFQTTVPGDIWQTMIHRLGFDQATGNTLNSVNIVATNTTTINLTATNASITNASITNATSTNLFAANASLTNATTTNLFGIFANLINLLSTDATITNATSTNLYAENGVIDNATTTNLFGMFANLINLLSTDATITNATTTNFFSTNASITNATSTELFSVNASITNATTTNLFAVLATFLNLFVENLTFTNATGTNLQVANASTTNLVATGTSVITNLYGDLATFTSATTTNLYATDSVLDNATTTNLFTAWLTALNGVIDNLLFVNATGTNLQLANLSTTDIVATGTATTSNLVLTNSSPVGPAFTIVSSGTDGGQIQWLNGALRQWNIDQTGTDLRFFTEDPDDTNGFVRVSFAENGDISANGISVVNALATNLSSTNSTLTNATSTNFFATNASITNATTVNFFTNFLSAMNAVFENLLFVNATGTNLQVANLSTTDLVATGTATITNALVTNATLSNAEILAGNATLTNVVAVNANLTNLLGTDATITNATVTNLFATLANFLTLFVNSLGFNSATGNTLQLADLSTTNINATGTATITNAVVTNATLSNAEILAGNATLTNVVAVNADLTNLLGTDATITNATSTNFFSTNASITNATTVNFFTNFLSAMNAVFENLLFVNATGTNLQVANLSTTDLVATGTATITNALVTNATLSNAEILAGNATLTNVVAVNADLTNLLGTDATITNATTSNLFTSWLMVLNAMIDNLVATNASITNATTTDLFVGNMLTALSGMFTSLMSTDAVFTNATATNATTTNLVSENASITNLLATNATFTNIYAVDGMYSLGTTTMYGSLIPHASTTWHTLGTLANPWAELFVSSSSIYIGGNKISNVNGVLTWDGGGIDVSGGSSTLSVDDIMSQNINASTTQTENLMATNATITNATSTNIFTSWFRAINATIDNLLFTNATGTTLQLADLSTTNLVATGTATTSDLVLSNSDVFGPNFTLESSSIDGGQIHWRNGASRLWSIDQLGTMLRFFNANPDGSGGLLRVSFSEEGVINANGMTATNATFTNAVVGKIKNTGGTILGINPTVSVSNVSGTVIVPSSALMSLYSGMSFQMQGSSEVHPPAPTDMSDIGRIFLINNVGTNTIRVAGSFVSGTGETVGPGQSKQLVWLGSNWHIVSSQTSGTATNHSIRKGVTQSTTLTTLQNDNQLTFPIGKNEKWFVQVKFEFSATGGGGPEAVVALNNTATGGTCNYSVVNASEVNSTTNCSTALVTNIPNGGDDTGTLSGIVTTGDNAGNVVFQFARSGGVGGSSVTNQADSHLIAFKLEGADLAEVYFAKDKTISEGDVVVLDGTGVSQVSKANKNYQKNVLGIVSTKPGMIIGEVDGVGKPVVVGLSGRVPVKVTTKNGEIKAGDFLTASDIPGVAMKATKAGQVIGQALTDYSNSDTNAVGSVVVFIKNTYYDGNSDDDTAETIADKFTALVKNALEKLSGVLLSINLWVSELKANVVVAEKASVQEFCVGNECFTEADMREFRNYLNSRNAGNTGNNNTTNSHSGGGGNTSSNTTEGSGSVSPSGEVSGSESESQSASENPVTESNTENPVAENIEPSTPTPDTN